MKKLFMIVMVFVSNFTFANEVECLSTLRRANSKYLEVQKILKKRWAICYKNQRCHKNEIVQ